jgi:cytochrome c biogenesis protein CcdA/thiol-disulfide isomerase/thioredoxin
MIGLLFIGLLAGLIAGVSPCILPVLPVVFAGWIAPVTDQEHPMRARRRRALAVVAGLVLSFSIFTLVGTVVLSALGLPSSFWHYAGIVVTGLVGLGLMIPVLGHLLERPFAKLALAPPTGSTSGFFLGLALGAVFVPCAGPVLSAIVFLGSHHHVSFESVLLTFFFAVGAATPLLIVALAGDAVVQRNRAITRRARQLRPWAGALLVLVSLSILFNLTNAVQRWVPGYTTSLQKTVEGNAFALHALSALSHEHSSDGQITQCVDGFATLQHCGSAPQFTGITKWLNTPGDRALSLSALRGHVVLVDFWTYSCINCQRTLPHVEAWYARYHRDGLDVIGVHSPEFDFEHVVSNISAAAASLHVKYPIAVDNNLSTWGAYGNEYWPAEYLIDASGQLRHVDFGEGNYPLSERLIRQLLRAAHPGVILPAPSDLPDTTPTTALSYETYLGTSRAQYYDNGNLVGAQYYDYSLPSPIPAGTYGLGGSWNVGTDSTTAGAKAKLNINFLAHDVYLVVGGQGTLTVRVQGTTHTIAVSGFPRLYTLFSAKKLTSTLMRISASSGVQAYDFTFG